MENPEAPLIYAPKQLVSAEPQREQQHTGKRH